MDGCIWGPKDVGGNPHIGWDRVNPLEPHQGPGFQKGHMAEPIVDD